MEIHEITRIVCDYTHEDEADLKSKSRFKELTFARYMIYFIAAKFNYSYGFIGKTFNRDRTSIYIALNTAIPNLLATNYDNFRTKLNDIESGLRLNASVVAQDGVVSSVNLTFGLNK